MSVEKPLHGFSLQISVLNIESAERLKARLIFLPFGSTFMPKYSSGKNNTNPRKKIRTPILFQGSYNSLVAERRGFEPPIAFTILAFQAGTLDHSDTSP